MSIRTRKPTHLPKPPGLTRKSADSTLATVENGSPPPKIDLVRSDGGFSSLKLDIPNLIDETHERRSDLPRSVQIHRYSSEVLVVFG